MAIDFPYFSPQNHRILGGSAGRRRRRRAWAALWSGARRKSGRVGEEGGLRGPRYCPCRASPPGTTSLLSCQCMWRDRGATSLLPSAQPWRRAALSARVAALSRHMQWRDSSQLLRQLQWRDQTGYGPKINCQQVKFKILIKKLKIKKIPSKHFGAAES